MPAPVHAPDQGGSVRASSETPSIRPALIVVAVVAVVVLLGVVFALLGAPNKANLKPGERVSGSSLAAYPARSVLAPVVGAGEPPKDVLGNLVVPKGATRLSSSCDSIDLYDCKVRITLPQAPPTVLGFYQSTLPHLGWKRISVSSTDHGLGTELLEQIPSNDGYYWEVGVFVDPSGGSLSGSVGGSVVRLQVVEEPDGD